MNLDDLGNLGELIGAVAVVISLAYLAVQIRQNTRSLRAAAFKTSPATSQTSLEASLGIQSCAASLLAALPSGAI